MTATSSGGRVAEVLTDGGSHVTVIGTPAGPDPSGVNGRTSVDRTYEVGVRYEFDPRNSTSPYEDNACTGTHAVSPLAPTTSPAPTTAPDPSATTVSSSSAAGTGPDTGGGRLTTITVIAIAAVVGLGVAAAAVRRHRTSRADHRT